MTLYNKTATKAAVGSSGITFDIDAAFPVSTTIDGNYQMHGAGTVTAVTPAETGSGALLRNGAAHNITGSPKTNGVDATPFDGRHGYGDTYRAEFPLEMVPGDTLIVCKSAAERTVTERTRPPYSNSNGRSFCDEMAILTCVGYPSADGLLRMAGLGNSSFARTLRTHAPLYAVNLKLELLTEEITLSSLASSPPSITEVEAFFSDFCGIVRDGWSSYYITPDYQFLGYGSYVSAMVSIALCYLNSSDYTTEQKRPLAQMLTQWGCDLFGAYLDGRKTYPLGGHCQGEKALIVFSGLMTGSREMINIDATMAQLYPTDPDRFQENTVFSAFDNTSSDAVDGHRWFWSESPTWSYRYNFREQDGQYQSKAPALWTPNNGTHTSEAFRFTYIDQVAGSHLGTALAMQLMETNKPLGVDWNLRAAMGLPYMTFLENWADGPPSAARDAITGAHNELRFVNWGGSYAVDLSSKICEEAWSQAWPL